MKRSITIDYVVMVGLAVFAVVASFALHATFLVSTFLFFGLPILYLLKRTKKPKWREASAMALVYGTLYGFLCDYLAQVNNVWTWSPTLTYRILGVVSPEAIIWGVLWVLLLVFYYEHAIEHSRTDRVSPRIWIAVISGVLAGTALILIATFAPHMLTFPYAYAVIGICITVPFFGIVWNKPVLIPKLAKASAYFIPLFFAYELTARYLGQWWFPGQYVGIVSFGAITFPFEELVVWIIFSSMAMLSYYEFSIDDLK